MSDRMSKISSYHLERNKKTVNKQRLGILAPIFGFILISTFALFLFPLFMFMLIFNQLYFWIRNQNSIPLRPYYDFNRHKIEHLSFIDRVWCEYCEWANGSLQWILDIVNEIERRYCPIKSQCNPHCSKVKKWRDDFLEYGHDLKELEKFMLEGDYEKISACEKKIKN